MEIKVEVLESGSKWIEEFACLQCGKKQTVEVSKNIKEGMERCWHCGALLKWEVVE